MRRIFFLLLVLSIASGCTPRTAGAFLFGVALASELHHLGHEHEVIYEREVVYVTAPAPPASVAPSPRDSAAPSDPPARVDAPGAREALAKAPVASCKDRGVPTGYGHAKVTFAPNGHATKVVIDAPANLAPEAVACVGDKLGAATVPPFDGAPVTVGTTWYTP
jgi:hypothetical protein